MEDIFIKKMRGVTPIKNKNEKITKTYHKVNTLKTEETQKKENEIVSEQTKKNRRSKYEFSFGEINKDLKKGKIKIERKLDLHGLSLLEAEELLRNEIIKSYNNYKRCILVITGKGLYLKNREDKYLDEKNPKLYYGKIKNSVKTWFQHPGINKYILTYQEAGPEHGGDGAIFIYLRKRKN